jgi:endonuclease/exonuclease/phosphatase family metal-dependent hydrolase
MRKVILFILIHCIASIAYGQKKAGIVKGEPKHFTVIKVMSYNIHHANPPSKPGLIDLDSIAGVIKKENPDLVAVQEVDVHTGRSGSSINQAEELAVKTGMQVYFAKAIDHDGGEYGVAILSRFPLTAMTTHKLPTIESTKGEPRVLATAEVQLPGDQKIIFACTHFDALRTDSNRVLQVKEAIRLLKKEIHPVILAGDLNAAPGGEVINELDKHFTRTCKKNCGFTIPVDKPKKTIDFIAYSTGDPFKVISHKVIDEKYASDHLPVVAELQLK